MNGLNQRKRYTHSERRCPLPDSEVAINIKNPFYNHCKKTLCYAWLSLSLSFLLYSRTTTNAYATSTSTAHTPVHDSQDHPRHPRVTDRACYLQTHYLLHGTPLTLVAEPSRAHDSTKERGNDPFALPQLTQCRIRMENP